MTLFAMIAFAAAAGFLVLGLASMAQGGEFDQSHAVQYMTGRVVMQGIAVLFILLAMLSAFH
ncbi:MAG: HIG1 domain-containing protein [Burkholderiales bacterium]